MKEKRSLNWFTNKYFWILLLGGLLHTTRLRAQTDVWEYLGAWHSSVDINNSREGKTALTLKVNEIPLNVPYTGHFVDFIVPTAADQQLLCVTVRGADGGSRVNTALLKAFHTKGGGGAIIEGYIKIGSGAYEAPPGSVIRYIVGKRGDRINSILTEGADGGAGSGLFLQKAGESTWHTLMVAGGGGGAYSDCCSSHAEGHSASTGTSGKDGGGDGGKGGSNGDLGKSSGALQFLFGPYGFGGGGLYGGGYNGEMAAIQNGIPTGHTLDLVQTQSESAPSSSESVLFGCGYGGRSSSAGGGGGGYSGGGGGGSCAGGGGGGSYLDTQWVIGGKITIADNTNDPQNGFINFYFTKNSAIKLAADNSKCLDDYGAKTDNNTNIQLYHCHDHPAQQWIINDSSIKLNKDLSKCIDLDNGQTTNGTNIRLWDCVNDNKNQYWIYDVANQSIRSGVDFNKCMDLDQGNTADGSNIRIWDCNKTDSQKWLVEDIPTAMPAGTHNTIRMAQQPEKCVDIAQSGIVNGTNVQLWDCNGTSAQLFTFEDRSIKLTQLAANKCLDLTQSGNGNGTNIQLYDCNGTKAQEWIYNGFSKSFHSAVNINKCLDIDHSNTANGTNIQLWDCNGTDAQTFVLGQ